MPIGCNKRVARCVHHRRLRLLVRILLGCADEFLCFNHLLLGHVPRQELHCSVRLFRVVPLVHRVHDCAGLRDEDVRPESPVVFGAVGDRDVDADDALVGGGAEDDVFLVENLVGGDGGVPEGGEDQGLVEVDGDVQGGVGGP